ncbi:MAG: hypothetical protein IPK11_09310 [Ignavibacteria bacterium]|nr:hypothetical protein [Ignavibacteria bacterium]
MEADTAAVATQLGTATAINWDWDDDRDNVGDTIIDGDTVIIWERIKCNCLTV